MAKFLAHGSRARDNEPQRLHVELFDHRVSSQQKRDRRDEHAASDFVLLNERAELSELKLWLDDDSRAHQNRPMQQLCQAVDMIERQDGHVHIVRVDVEGTQYAEYGL